MLGHFTGVLIESVSDGSSSQESRWAMNFFSNLMGKSGRKLPRVDLAQRFERLGPLGTGSMSEIFRARDKVRGQMVALKILDIERLKELNNRFLGREKPTEGEIAFQLRHQYIVKTFDFGISPKGEEFLAMEIVEGAPLGRLIEAKSDRIHAKGLRYLIQIAEGLSYIHQQGWIHRDICPRNILINMEDQVRLIDFGLMVPNTPDFQSPGNRTGTANYMAPELLKRQRTDQRIDIFSYSVTAYEMLSGRRPWEAGQSLDKMMSLINQPPLDIREAVPGLPDGLAEIIMKGLQKPPDDRWQTMGDVVKALHQFKVQQNRGR